jgi:hypothetical protein
MMKLLALFALALSIQVLHAETPFTLTWDNVASQNIDIPEFYQGTATLTFYPLPTEDVEVCINWLVPAEAPEDVELNVTWPQTCQFAKTITRGEDPYVFNVSLRSSTNVLSAALISEDYDSDGGEDETFEFNWDIAYQPCEMGTSGPYCTAVSNIEYDNVTTVYGSAVLRLPTYNIDQPDRFIQSLVFQASASAEAAGTDAVVKYRLNGPVSVSYDGVCNLSKCSIPNPPFSSVEGYFWEISVVGDATFKIVAQYCSAGKLGATCKIAYTEFDNEPGVPYIRTGPSFFVVTGTELAIAVGGVDGYTQEDTAPPVRVQLDARPTALFYLSSGINSKANRLGFSLAGVANEQSRYVVWVQADSKASYGIWIPTNDTNGQCPQSCSNHGNCTDYVCECDDKYNGLGCEHEVKNFTIEYIILIAVGGLLVLSIVIGVPIYCWMNRQQDYETIE